MSEHERHHEEHREEHHEGHHEGHGHSRGCGCGFGGGRGHWMGHGPHPGWHRRFFTREERIAHMEQYLEALRTEAKAVEEAIAELKRAGSTQV